MLETFHDRTFDLLVIGSGITGAGIARDAVLRGLSVCLVEKGDFGSGTSSKSSKLIHGGLRYLEQGQFKLVYESLHERTILMRTAPHLVRPLPLLVPIYKGDPRPAWKIRLGLKAYDILAGRENVGAPQWLKPFEVPDLEEEISLRDMKKSALFYDCQMNDARLCLENILDAEARGAVCLNYTEVKGIIRGPAVTGPIIGVEVENVFHKEKSEIRARKIVCAAGPWTDVLRKKIGPQTPPLLRPTKGVHLLVPNFLNGHGALLFARQDKRPFFVLPFSKELTLIGTTDTDFDGSPDDVHASEKEIAYLLKEAQRVFRHADLSASSVVSTFAGVRPLIRSSRSFAGARPREHKIVEEGGLLFIIGGKYTTYRRMAAEVVDRVAAELTHQGGKCKTDRVPLYGTPEEPFDEYAAHESETLQKHFKIDPQTARRLVQSYGTRARQLLAPVRDDPSLRNPLCPHTEIRGAELLYACEHERIQTTGDFLLRRTWMGYGACRGHDAVESIQGILRRHGKKEVHHGPLH